MDTKKGNNPEASIKRIILQALIQDGYKDKMSYDQYIRQKLEIEFPYYFNKVTNYTHNKIILIQTLPRTKSKMIHDPIHNRDKCKALLNSQMTTALKYTTYTNRCVQFI